MVGVTGKDLVKTGKVIRIRPERISEVYWYMKYKVTWDTDAFIKKLTEISPHLDELEYAGKVDLANYDDGRKSISIKVPVDTVILPVYIRDKSYMAYDVYKGLIEHKTKGVVDIEEFSLFDVYKVTDKPSGRLGKVYFSTRIEHREDIKNYGIKSFGISISERSTSELSRIHDFSKTHLTFAVFTDGPYDYNFIKDCINVIKRLQGTPYSELPRIEATSSSVLERNIRKSMLFLEQDLTSLLNSIHFLHSHEFDENGIIGWLFKPYSGIVKGFRCEFEKALTLFADVLTFFRT
jgi:hypothetical protein